MSKISHYASILGLVCSAAFLSACDKRESNAENSIETLLLNPVDGYGSPYANFNFDDDGFQDATISLYKADGIEAYESVFVDISNRMSYSPDRYFLKETYHICARNADKSCRDTYNLEAVVEADYSTTMIIQQCSHIGNSMSCRPVPIIQSHTEVESNTISSLVGTGAVMNTSHGRLVYNNVDLAVRIALEAK